MPEFDFSKPVVIFAPMAGLSDAPMRELVGRFGVDAVISEMLASQEFESGREGVAARADRGNLDANVRFIVQIAGRDPKLMAKTAQFAASQGAEQIDINMGCPAKKVTSGATAGAALLREPDLALEIVETVANAVNLPVSVKTRLGWEEKTIHEFAPSLVNAGACMLTIHGRTRAQKYSGAADWAAIARVKDAVNVPVIANGDIINLKTARLSLAQSGADGVMIGRGVVGAPWIPAHIRAALRGEEMPEKNQLSEIVISHYQDMIAYYGVDLGARIARKHLKAYLGGDDQLWREIILSKSDPDKIINLLRNLDDHTWEAPLC